jgi:hypothetical protein
VWEIGVANRTATEFAGGDRFFEPDITLQYPKLFPQDVTYTIGQSTPGKDWFYAHVPHSTAQARVQPFSGVAGEGSADALHDSLPYGGGEPGVACCGSRFVEPGHAPFRFPSTEMRRTNSIRSGEGVIARHQVQGLW